MKFSLIGVAFAFGVSQAPAGPDLTGFPFADESLNYSVNWPSGLSLGEAHMKAHHAADGWKFDLTLDADIPGFRVADKYHSEATADLCSTLFTRDSSHGSKESHESDVFDRTSGTVSRTTVNGGKSQIAAPDCAKDGLAFLYATRRELGQGRVPSAQMVLFGSSYNATLAYTGLQTVTVNDRTEQADCLTGTLTGPNSEVKLEMFFARDPARTLVAVRVPLSAGKFSMELVR